MTPAEIALVQQTWEKVAPIAKQAATLFYGRLFEIAPHVRPLFGSDIEEQGKKLMMVLSTVVRGLKNVEHLEEVVWQLGRRHVAYQVKDEDYAVVAQALIWTLEQGLGADFTPEVKQAWVNAYTLLANVMQAGAHANYANFSIWKAAQ